MRVPPMEHHWWYDRWLSNCNPGSVGHTQVDWSTEPHGPGLVVSYQIKHSAKVRFFFVIIFDAMVLSPQKLALCALFLYQKCCLNHIVYLYHGLKMHLSIIRMHLFNKLNINIFKYNACNAILWLCDGNYIRYVLESSLGLFVTNPKWISVAGTDAVGLFHFPLSIFSKRFSSRSCE